MMGHELLADESTKLLKQRVGEYKSNGLQTLSAAPPRPVPFNKVALARGRGIVFADNGCNRFAEFLESVLKFMESKTPSGKIREKSVYP